MAKYTSIKDVQPSQAVVKLEDEDIESFGLLYLFKEDNLSAPTGDTRNLHVVRKYQPVPMESPVKNTANISPESPLVISPANTASTVSTPGDKSDTPTGTMTPITPPTSDKVLKTYTHVLGEPESPTTTIKSVAGKETFTIDSANRGQKEHKLIFHSRYEDELFKPGKLIRNLTKELEAIAHANSTAVPWTYNLVPSFDFENFVDFSRPKNPTSSHVKQKNEVTNAYSTGSFDVKYVKPEAHPKAVLPAKKTTKELKLLELIIPHTIQTRLTREPHKCVATLQRSLKEKCWYGGPSGSVKIIIKNLLKCHAAEEYVAMIYHIKQLVLAVMCKTHQNVALCPKRQNELESLVASFARAKTEDFAAFQVWIESISSSSLLPDTRDLAECISRTDPPTRSYKSANTSRTAPANETKTDSTFGIFSNSPKFLPYEPSGTKSLSVSAALHKELCKPLKFKDAKEGFIYLFWDKENFGKVKIGRTNDLKRRLNEWTNHCGREHFYHPAIMRGELPKTPYYKHVEKLIHIELKDYRRQRYCEKGNGKHIEWFEVGDTMVARVFQKWHDWIIQEPYELDTREGVWVLRAEKLDTLAEVCQPVHVEPAPRMLPQGRVIRKGKQKAKRRTI